MSEIRECITKFVFQHKFEALRSFCTCYKDSGPSKFFVPLACSANRTQGEGGREREGGEENKLPHRTPRVGTCPG